MKHRVDTLEGALLDAAVAKADGEQARIESNGRCAMLRIDREHGDGAPFWASFRPSTEWHHGGPIIERDRIALSPPEASRDGRWEAWTGDGSGGGGPTPLIAAMRAYVASKVGGDEQLGKEEVELP